LPLGLPGAARQSQLATTLATSTDTNFFFEHLLLRANLLISPATLLALEFSFLSDAVAKGRLNIESAAQVGPRLYKLATPAAGNMSRRSISDYPT
jgi:hypothetical protein